MFTGDTGLAERKWPAFSKYCQFLCRGRRGLPDRLWSGEHTSAASQHPCSASRVCPAGAHGCPLPPNPLNVFSKWGKPNPEKNVGRTPQVCERCNKILQMERTKCSNRDRTEERSTWLVPGNLIKETTYRVQAIRGKPSELLIFAYWLSYDFPLKFLHFLECWKYGSAGGNVGGGGSRKNNVVYPASPELPCPPVHHMKRFPQEGASVTAPGPLFISVTYKLYQ